MLDNNTVRKLHEMKLSAMAAAFQKQLQDSSFADMLFEERFGMLADAEWTARKNNRLKRLIRSADYAFPNACLEDVEYHADRRLDKALIARLGTCGYIDEFHNIIILGATGSGKTYLACALAQKACREGKRCLYFHFPELLQELSISRAEGSQRLLVRKLATRDLLVIDDWLREPVSAEIARGLADLMDDRFRNKSTLFVTQFPVAEWHGRFQDPTLADAVLDRIVHDSYRIELSGDSMRKRTSDLTKSAT